MKNGGDSSVAPPVDEMKFFLDNLPIICNAQQMGLLIPLEKEQDAIGK
jgi:hypothetical protein